MNPTPIRLDQRSVVAHILLGRPRNSLHTAVAGLKLVGLMFEQIGRLSANNDDLAELLRYGHRTISDMAVECADHASSGDVLGAVDCLQRTISGHRTARSLLIAVLESVIGDAAVLARQGVTLIASILDDLGEE